MCKAEVPIDYCKEVPEGLILHYQLVRWWCFKNLEDEDYDIAVDNISKAKEIQTKYIWIQLAEDLPSFQMEPQGYRGYIEGHPVVKI